MTAQAREEEEAKRDENFQGIHSLNIYRIRAQPHIYPNNPFSAILSLSVVNHHSARLSRLLSLPCTLPVRPLLPSALTFSSSC